MMKESSQVFSQFGVSNLQSSIIKSQKLLEDQVDQVIGFKVLAPWNVMNLDVLKICHQ